MAKRRGARSQKRSKAPRGPLDPDRDNLDIASGRLLRHAGGARRESAGSRPARAPARHGRGFSLPIVLLIVVVAAVVVMVVAGTNNGVYLAGKQYAARQGATEVTGAPLAKDSDGSLPVEGQYFVAGACADGRGSQSDYCFSATQLVEFVAAAPAGQVSCTQTLITCPDGCQAGACIQAGGAEASMMFIAVAKGNPYQPGFQGFIDAAEGL